MLLNSQGQPLASDDKVKKAVERLNTVMIEVRAFCAEKEYQAEDIINIGMNLIIQTVMESQPQDNHAIKQRCVQAMKMLDAGLGQALQMWMIEAKVRAQLEAANTPQIAS